VSLVLNYVVIPSDKTTTRHALAGRSAPILIDDLADHPALVSRVSGWLHAEWLAVFGLTPGYVESRLRDRLNHRQLPVAWVAYCGARPVGTVSLSEEESPLSPERITFLSSLFVLPRWRKQGIGTRLCRRAVAEAYRFECSELYLHTLDQQAFYESQGWTRITEFVVNGGPSLELATLMTYQLELPDSASRVDFGPLI